MSASPTNNRAQTSPPTLPLTPPPSSEKLIATLETLPPTTAASSDLLEAAEQLRRDVCTLQWKNKALEAELRVKKEKVVRLENDMEDLRVLMREVETEKEEWMERYGVVRQEMVEVEEGLEAQMRYC